MKQSLGFKAVLVLLFAVLFMVVSCGEQEVTIRWWALSGGGGAEDERTKENKQYAADFMAEHPNVTIELTVLENEAFKQKIKAAVNAGDPPDLFHSWGGGVMLEFANLG